MKSKNKLWEYCLKIEQYLCPDFCGVVDRRRVIAYVFLSFIEALVIPYHFFLFYHMEGWIGFIYNIVHVLGFCFLLYLIWKRKVVFKNGISWLYLWVFLKLVVDSLLCLRYGAKTDNLSVLGNIFVMFCLAITALSQQLNKTSLVITIGLVPMILVAIIHTQLMVMLFSGKAMLVGFLMIGYVWIYNMDYVTQGLRQPRLLKDEERKALEILADLKEDERELAVNLMNRLSQEQQKNIVTRAAELLESRELDRFAWDKVCAELTNSEKQICHMILEGKSLKEICIELNKSESNITSQRSHIRKKLNMDRRDDLRRELEKRFYEARKAVEA